MQMTWSPSAQLAPHHCRKNKLRGARSLPSREEGSRRCLSFDNGARGKLHLATEYFCAAVRGLVQFARVNPAEQLIVFVKAPRVGEVKTRMAETMGADRACEAYREMAARLLDTLSVFDQVELRFTPHDARDEITSWLKQGWTAAAQGDGDLGARMHRASTDAFARGAERVVIIGSDCVELKTQDIRSAFRELKTFDVVVGPALDGGYWLIGLRVPRAELFQNITWSTDAVLGQTLQHAKALGLRIQLLRILSDIDTEEDWERSQ
jgi:uncharacterized protein